MRIWDHYTVAQLVEHRDGYAKGLAKAQDEGSIRSYSYWVQFYTREILWRSGLMR